MQTNEVRLLRADEIECRVGTIRENGLSLLLYKDARVDQKILDETFGAFCWQRRHDVIDGDLYCTVSVLDRDTGNWIAKQDVGVSANAEKEKSRASDAFKRACVNWGIGRELYSAPFIWIGVEQAKIQKSVRNGVETFFTKERFSVSAISYDESSREIQALCIVNGSGETVYRYGSRTEQETDKPMVVITERQKTSLMKQLDRTGVALSAVLERYKIESLDVMTPSIYQKAMAGLKATADKAA